MRRICFPLVIGLSGMVMGVGEAAENVDSPAREVARLNGLTREANSKLEASFHKKVRVEWSNEPLQHVLQELAKTTGSNFWIDHAALLTDGVNPEALNVELHLGDMTVWPAMDLILKPLQLDWYPEDGICVVTTKTAAEGKLFTRVYDVSRTVEILQTRLKALKIRNPFAPGIYGAAGLGGDAGAGGLGGPGGPGGFGMGQGFGMQRGELGIKVSPGETSPVEGQLETVIQEVIRGRWEMIDGDGGVITVGKGKLTIRQTHRVHLQVAGLLNAIEEFVVKRTKSKSIPVSRPGYPFADDAVLIKRLAEPASINVTDEPLEEVLMKLAETHGFRILIDRAGLSADGVSPEQPVTLNLSGVSLSGILDKLLMPLNLAREIGEGSLKITTKAGAEAHLSTVVYFTGDVPESHKDDLSNAIQEGTSGLWEATDGEGGTMWKLVPDWIVVRTTQAVHREVIDIIEGLRHPEAVPAPPTGDEIELKLYPISDSTAIKHLLLWLPKVIPDWNANGEAPFQLGNSIAIRQSSRVHDQVESILDAVEQAHTQQILKQLGTATPPAAAPAMGVAK